MTAVWCDTGSHPIAGQWPKYVEDASTGCRTCVGCLIDVYDRDPDAGYRLGEEARINVGHSCVEEAENRGTEPDPFTPGKPLMECWMCHAFLSWAGDALVLEAIGR